MPRRAAPLLPAQWKTLTLALVATAATGLVAYWLLVPLRHVFAVAFAGVLLGVAWSSLADLINVRRVLPRGVAVGLIGVLGLGVWIALGFWIGPMLADQFEHLGARLGEAVQAGRRLLGESEAGRAIEQRLPELQQQAPGGAAVLKQAWRALGAGFGALGDVFIIFFVGLFVAASPRLYRRGLLHLLPKPRRLRAGEVLQQMGRALQRWLLARALLMLMVGVLFGVGLWILGVPLALPLGLIAGLFEFVPYIGPISAMFPALAVALMEGPEQALYVGVLYVATQLIESYVAEPLIEGKTLSLPPALIILFQVVCGLWLGVIGIVIATPLLVVTMVAVQTFYVQDVLGDEMQVAGQGDEGEDEGRLAPRRPAHGGV